MEFTEKDSQDYLKSRTTKLFNKAKEVSKQQNIDEINSFIEEINDEICVGSTLLLTMCRQNIDLVDQKRRLKNLYKEILARLIVEIEGI